MCEKTFDVLTHMAIESLKHISVKETDHVVYDLEQGSAIAFTLKENVNVQVLDSFMSKGTIFPLHHHVASSETLILEAGAVTVVCDDPDCPEHRAELKAGMPLTIPCKMNHFLHAKEDSWILAILVPPDKGMIT